MSTNNSETKNHIRALIKDQPAYTLKDLTEENALILDNLEEYEERISRIENCLLDLSFALRGTLAGLDFAKLKKKMKQEESKRNKNSRPTVQANGDENPCPLVGVEMLKQ